MRPTGNNRLSTWNRLNRANYLTLRNVLSIGIQLRKMHKLMLYRE